MSDDPISTAWMADGLCVGSDPTPWFPNRGETSTWAQSVCRGCPVRSQCLDYALDNGIKHGVWGGVSERGRRRLRRERAARQRDVA